MYILYLKHNYIYIYRCRTSKGGTKALPGISNAVIPMKICHGAHPRGGFRKACCQCGRPFEGAPVLKAVGRWDFFGRWKKSEPIFESSFFFSIHFFPEAVSAQGDRM